MVYLKNNILFFLLLSCISYGQTYNYSYIDPCTLATKSIVVPQNSQGIVVNYFGNIQTFTTNDFSTGVFDDWVANMAQINSSAPCDEVTTTLVNGISNITVANTLTVVTNVISVTSVAQTLTSVSGGAFTSTAESISNADGGSTNQNQENEEGTNNSTGTGNTTTGQSQSNSSGTQTNNSNEGSQTSNPSTGGTSNQSGGSNSNSTQSNETGGEQTQPTVEEGPNTESAMAEEGKSGGGGNLANSVSNSVDGGSADGGSKGGKKSNSTNKNIGSLIASGDIVAIANTDNSQNVRVVGSITHANTQGTRIKGVLFNFTTGVNNLNITFYKSWVNRSRKLNTVAANSFMMDFDKNFFSTTTILESYKINRRVTAMFGLNGTAGKMGERTLLNLSAVGGGHATFKVTNKVSTSMLVLGVYSPFTQFYDGEWWDAGILIVPFNSWDLKITKTFKLNISFTGVYETGKTFLNYQILTGGKLNF